MESVNRSMLFFTCFSVHNDDTMSPITRRMILSIHKDVSHTTCTLSLSWIITTFASNVDGRYSCKEHNNNKNNLLKGVTSRLNRLKSLA